MSNKTVEELKPGFCRIQKTTVTGTRVRHIVTFNPNTANPKEKLHIQIPKLKEKSCLSQEVYIFCTTFRVKAQRVGSDKT